MNMFASKLNTGFGNLMGGIKDLVPPNMPKLPDIVPTNMSKLTDLVPPSMQKFTDLVPGKSEPVPDVAAAAAPQSTTPNISEPVNPVPLKPDPAPELPPPDMTQFQDPFLVKKFAQPGDMIEIQRSNYSHYALYMGNGKVMTVHADDNTIAEAQVYEGTMEQVCNGCKARVKNHDEIATAEFSSPARSLDDIIWAARYFQDKVVPYQFNVRNSEYYCCFWRYGVGFSTQTAKSSSNLNGPYHNDTSSFNGNEKLGDVDKFQIYKEIAKSSSKHNHTGNTETYYTPSHKMY